MQNEMIDFNDVLYGLWRKLPIILVSVLVGAIAGIVLAYNAKQLYQSDTTLLPVMDYGQQFSQSSMGGVGGLASLAGIDLGNKDSNQLKRIEYLTSRDFLIPFIQKYQLKKIIFDYKWDEEDSEWLPPFWGKRLIAWLRGQSLEYEPTELQAYQEFLDDHFRVDEDTETGFIKAILWLPDPEKAQQILINIVVEANSIIGNKEQEQVKKRIAYLEREAEKTRVMEIKSAMFGLLEVEYKQLMLANIADEYAFETLEKPQLPERLSKPSKVLYLIIGSFLGLCLSTAVLLLFNRPQL